MKTKNVITAVSVLLVFLLFLIFDRAIVSSVSSMQRTWLNQVMVLISYLGISLVLMILTTCVLFFHDKRKIFSLLASFALTSIMIFFLKLIVHRIRPFEELGINTLNFLIGSGYSTWDFSFPSLHTALVFSALPFFTGKLKKYWLVFACLVGFSRLFFALHYPSDILAGAVIGFITGTILMRFFHLKKGILR